MCISSAHGEGLSDELEVSELMVEGRVLELIR